MIAQEFDYEAPLTLSDALQSMADHRVKPLAGGMSLIPMMKLRLAAPEILVDLHQVAELRSIKLADGLLSIGAMVTHYELESTPLVRTGSPLLAAVAGRIGDVQVRNRGTIGGAIAHSDPAADYPAALLAMDTILKLASTRGERTLPVAKFFLDPFTTALEPGELITEVQVPVESSGTGISYEKYVQPASGFAVVGIAVRIARNDGKITTARVGVTGLGPIGYRAARTETLILGKEGTTDEFRAAAAVVADGIEANSDLHASAEYRCHLARVLTARALTIALSRAL